MIHIPIRFISRGKTNDDTRHMSRFENIVGGQSLHSNKTMPKMTMQTFQNKLPDWTSPIQHTVVLHTDREEHIHRKCIWKITLHIAFISIKIWNKLSYWTSPNAQYSHNTHTHRGEHLKRQKVRIFVKILKKKLTKEEKLRKPIQLFLI